jgi:hypothetical protein
MCAAGHLFWYMQQYLAKRRGHVHQKHCDRQACGWQEHSCWGNWIGKPRALLAFINS